MFTPQQTSRIAPLFEMLIASPDAEVRDRLLIEAVLASGVAAAAALWRRAGLSASTPPSWLEICARGPAESLPTAGQVEAVHAGQLAAQLPEQRMVLVVGSSRPWALALGDVRDEETAELMECLLIASRLVHEADQPLDSPETPELIDLLPGVLPLPRSESGRTSVGEGGDAWPRDELAERKQRHDMRNLLTSIGATRDLLIHFGDDLDSGEEVHFQAILDRELQRAGSLMAESLLKADDPPLMEPGSCELSAVLREVIQLDHAALSSKGIETCMRIRARADGLRVAVSGASAASIVRELLSQIRALSARGGDGIVVELQRNETGSGGIWLCAEGGTGALESSGSRAQAALRKRIEAAGGRFEIESRAAGGLRCWVLFPLEERIG